MTLYLNNLTQNVKFNRLTKRKKRSKDAEQCHTRDRTEKKGVGKGRRREQTGDLRNSHANSKLTWTQRRRSRR